MVSIHEDGFKFVNYRTKEVMLQFNYSQVLASLLACVLDVSLLTPYPRFKYIYIYHAYPYIQPNLQLKNVEVNAYEDTITFNMDPKSLEDAPHYQFLCSRKEDMANMIASYSPAHRNWKQVCGSVCFRFLFK